MNLYYVILFLVSPELRSCTEVLKVADKQLNLGVKFIISLTDCVATNLIAKQTAKSLVSYVPIVFSNCRIQTTLFVAPIHVSVDRMAKAVYEVLLEANAVYAGLLSNGPTDLATTLQDTVLRDARNKQKQIHFETFLYTSSSFPSYGVRHEFPNLLAYFRKRGYTLDRDQYYLLFHDQRSPYEELRSISEASLFEMRYYWILAELTALEPIYLIKLFKQMTNSSALWFTSEPNFGFFRVFPIFQPKHCTSTFGSYLMLLFASQVYACDLTQVPESIVLISYILFLAGRAASIKRQEYCTECLSAPNNYYSRHLNRTVWLQRRNFHYSLSRHISDSKLDSVLWFFSVQTFHKSAQVEFVPTVKIPTNRSATLTAIGSFIYRASGVSGVFANQFYSFHGALLRVGVIKDGLFVTHAIKGANCELTNVSGLGVEILDAMAARFNFTYVLMEPFDSHYGVSMDGGNWTGLIGDLLNNDALDDFTSGSPQPAYICTKFRPGASVYLDYGANPEAETSSRIDMAVGLLTLTEQRAAVVQFLGPFMKTHVVTAIAQPLDNLRLFQMYKPFRFHVWFTTGVVMLLWAQITVLFNRYSSDSAWSRYDGEIASQEVSYLANLWAQIKAMVGQPNHTFSTACSTRILILSFWFTVVVWQTSWQATMTAQFSKEEFILPVKNLKDITKQSYIRPIFLSGTSVQSLFELSRNNDVYKKIYEMAMEDGIRVNDTCEGLQLVHRYRHYAFINDRYLLQTEMPMCGDDFIVLDEKIDESPASFAVQKHAPYADIFTLYFWDLYQRGIIEHWIEKWLPKTEDRVTNGAAYRPLNVEAVSGGFVPLVCAMTLSLLALTLEMMWHYHRSHTHVAPLNTKSANVDDSGSNAVNKTTH